MNAERKLVCIVGAGPRGLSVLERLLANERARRSCAAVTIHLVDPYEPGPGAVWRSAQSRLLLMNTVASQITVFTDTTSRIAGPIEPGPSLHDWAAAQLADADADLTARHDARTRAEIAGLGPDSYPTRALYGTYLQEMFERIVRDRPAHASVVTHRCRAAALTGGADAQRVRLENGTWLDDLDAVVLALGHLSANPTLDEQQTANITRAHNLVHVAPANPADVDLDGIEPGGAVLLRGLGLNFFDYLVLLTVGRGGAFERRDGRLEYRPSGREPRLHAGSRRGIPYHARGQNQKGAFGRHTPRVLTAEVAGRIGDRARAGEPVSFGADVWPLVALEVESVYYGTLLTSVGRDREREQLVDRYLATPWEVGRAALLDQYRIPERDRWNWQRLARPWHGVWFDDQRRFRAWLLDYLAADLREALLGNVASPLKAALDVLRDLRNEVRLAVDHAGLDGASYRDELVNWYTPLNAFLSIGPPASRIEEMIALIEAGVLTLTGPATEIRVDTAARAFVARSPLVPGPAVHATALIEARLPAADVRRTSDPMIQYLMRTGQAAAYRIPGKSGTHYETGGLAVTSRPSRLVDEAGLAHPRRFAYGVPTEAVHWATAAGIRPGSDSVILGDSDAIARAVLALPPLGSGRTDPVLDTVGVLI
jgi:uncharacterized NAD(P)/FAD-binding protein YdhS